MHDNRTHPLLEQIPLTVSPFVNLPTATTLPYTYKTMPSTLPPSATGIAAAATASNNGGTAANGGSNGGEGYDPEGDSVSAGGGGPKPQYVVSASGHAAHPDDIIASCRALQAHLARLKADADAELAALDERIRARDLAERRRVAPGWLDSDARMLEPERTGVSPPAEGDQSSGLGKGKGREDGQTGDVGIAGLQGRIAGLSLAGRTGSGGGGASEMAVPDEGEELDRAFGVMGLNR